MKKGSNKLNFIIFFYFNKKEKNMVGIIWNIFPYNMCIVYLYKLLKEKYMEKCDNI